MGGVVGALITSHWISAIVWAVAFPLAIIVATVLGSRSGRRPIIVDAPTTPGADTTDTYTWRYGRAWREGPELIQPTHLANELFDASTIDFSLVGELTREAMADTGWPAFESTYPALHRDIGGDVVFTVALSSPYYSAGYTYPTDGELLSRTGTGIG